MTTPSIEPNKWHLLSSNSLHTPRHMFDIMYPNSFVEFGKIYSVNSGWNPEYPYLGQTANCNWVELQSNMNMNPFLGYWVKVTNVHDTLKYDFDFAHMLSIVEQNFEYNSEYIRISYANSTSQNSVIISTSSIDFHEHDSYIYSSYDNIYIINSFSSSEVFFIGTSSRHWVEIEVTSQSIITTPLDTFVYASVNFNSIHTFTFDASSLYDFYYIHLTSSPVPESGNSIYLNQNSSFQFINDWNCPSKFIIHNSTRNSGKWIVQVFSQSVTFYIGNSANNWLEFQYDSDIHTLYINSSNEL